MKGYMNSIAINMNMVSEHEITNDGEALVSQFASAERERKAGSSSPGATTDPPSQMVLSDCGASRIVGPTSFSQRRRGKHYVCEVRSLNALVKQIAVHTIRWGYWWYVSGVIPPGKSLQEIDGKLMNKYTANVSASTRNRRKHAGLANARYYRWGRRFFLFTTLGDGPIWESEKVNLRCIRRPPRDFEKRTGYTGKFPYAPLQVEGYSISYKPGGRTKTGDVDPKWHSHVELDRDCYRNLKADFLETATKRKCHELGMKFYELPYEPYAPLYRQLLKILRDVNQKRRRSGIKTYVEKQYVPSSLRPMKVFCESKPNYELY